MPAHPLVSRFKSHARARLHDVETKATFADECDAVDRITAGSRFYGQWNSLWKWRIEWNIVGFRKPWMRGVYLLNAYSTTGLAVSLGTGAPSAIPGWPGHSAPQVGCRSWSYRPSCITSASR